MTRLVQDRFPEQSQEIAFLYGIDPEFRALCHDYGVCVAELKRVRSSVQFTAKQIEVAQDLKHDLELDIMKYLSGPKFHLE